MLDQIVVRCMPPFIVLTSVVAAYLLALAIAAFMGGKGGVVLDIVSSITVHYKEWSH